MSSTEKWAGEQSGSPDYDFRHHLYDTLILLGVSNDIAALLKKSQDGHLTEADVEVLRNYNIGLFTAMKDRLNRLNKLTLAPAR